MKSTGIIRRIDVLGRIIIPKEIRRNLGIRENEPFEIFIDYLDGKPVVCFQKYETSLLGSLTALSDRIYDEMSERWWSKRGEVRDHFDAIAKLIKEFEDR